MALKCPICGYDLSEPPSGYSWRTYGQQLLEKRGRRCRKILANLHKQIAKALPSNKDTRHFYEFLIRFKDLKDNVLLYAIQQYVQSNALYQGKGYKYLVAIVERVGKDSDKLKEFEKKRIGTTPPIKEIK